MSLAVCVLAYSLVVMVIGPSLLGRATRSGAAPRLGIVLWIGAMISVMVSWVLAVVLLGGELFDSWGHLDRVLTGCFAVLAALVAGGRGGIVQDALVAVIVVGALAVALVGARILRALHRARSQTRCHGEAALLAARGARGPAGALVVDAEHRSVYCLPGRARTIVITRAALAALDEAELDAVLTHERAHLAGHHHQLLAFSRALARILPGSRLFTEGAADVARLAEMRADDIAASRHGAGTVVAALLALAVPGPQPATALGATSLRVAERVERLLFPPGSARLRLAAATAAFLLGPLIIAAAVITQVPLCMTALS